MVAILMFGIFFLNVKTFVIRQQEYVEHKKSVVILDILILIAIFVVCIGE